MSFHLPAAPAALAACSLLLAAACAGAGAGTESSGLGGHGAHGGHGGDGGDGGDGHGGDGGHGGYEEDPAAAEACAYLANGPATAVTAADDPLAAPPIAADDRRHDVALFDFGSGTFGGTVSFTAPRAADFVLFLDADVAVVVEGPGGAPVSIHHRNLGSALCPGTIAVALNIPMTAGLHTLTFGPTPAAAVGVVIEASQAPPP